MPLVKVSKDTFSFCFIYFPVPASPCNIHSLTPFRILSQLRSKVIWLPKGRGREAAGSERPCNTQRLISSDIYLRSREEMEQLTHEDECRTRGLPACILPRDLGGRFGVVWSVSNAADTGEAWWPGCSALLDPVK